MMINKDWYAIGKKVFQGDFRGIRNWIYGQYFKRRDREGFSVTDAEWDYLIILDACRYDVFKEVNWIEGELSKVVSKGSHSVEFLNANFTDYYYNTIYVTANPHVSNYPSSQWAENQFISEEHFPYVNPVYSKNEYDEKGVSTPEGVTKEALRTKKDFPDSKMIVHYMQPHGPLIGKTSVKGRTVDEIVFNGGSLEEAREAYKANLERALESVEDLIEHLDGQIVITADHGELFGEYGITGHPPEIYFQELVEVPWLEIDKD